MPFSAILLPYAVICFAGRSTQGCSLRWCVDDVMPCLFAELEHVLIQDVGNYAALK